MNIHLVTGATGFVGRHLVNALLARGDTVWILVRPQDSTDAHARASLVFKPSLRKYPKTLQVLAGDVLERDLGISQDNLAKLRRNSVIIWHLAANLSFLTKDKEAVQATNYQGTVNALNLANKIGSEFFYASTAYVCGTAETMAENELDKGQQFHNQYEISKFQAEQYVRTHCKIPFLIFRPSIIIGDAHKGKAEGCTFGYYRYLFVFYFLKQKIVTALKKQLLLGRLLRFTGYQFKKNSLLVAPSLVLPFPKKATVDLIPVDYVVSSMITLSLSNLRNTGVHLTQKNLPTFGSLFKTALHDLGYRKVKYLPVPVWVFRSFLVLLYWLAFPVRKYIRSVMWYTPYITTTRDFEHRVATHILGVPPRITKGLITKINHHAKKDLLSDITI